MDLIYSLIAVIGTLAVSFIVSLFLPGIERKFIHARIQQRVGPPITSPGIMAPIKFFFKQTITPESPMPRLYNALPLISLIIIVFLLLFLIPEMYFLGALASIIAIVGLLKVEEIMYMFMGSLSRSVLSVRMPFPDLAKGAAHPETPRSFFEELSSLRAFRLIAFGSIPVYIALFVSVAMAGSIYLSDIIAYQQTHGPILFTVAGALGAIVFFIGYMILLNEYPFSILKGKPDVVEGPYLEYAAKYRAYVYMTRGFLMFTLATLFATLFLGIAPNILNPSYIITLIVALIFPMLMAVMSAFSPIFTYKQFYPTVAGVSIIGVLAIVAAFL
ncbi:respiratory chain complex I subunit 1 family protein [Methanobacterium petrolearium]|uniref:respiratory chain complex I subunit 1 family protein n=1 Tax=Methanobacterium petrolearium TaxID=710190 RepID=UPI001AEAD721|nr:NADH-quinone oxidoreductase subunit H [Methanobacterium petrolearium]MBP1946463.1 energy-converting hydrogenase B subunit O [Methanobacterium petrolearium]BDZ69800.1 NADH dehydrogenase [Methanobacterium petrolearium]